MLRIALRALRSRRTQALMLVFLSGLVSAAAVAAPFFIYASTEKLTVRDIAAAPAAQRDVTVTHDIDVGSVGASGLNSDMTDVVHLLTLPGFQTVASARVAGSVGPPADQSFGQISVRGGVCDHVVLVGRCPSAPNDAIISSVTSSLLATKIGGTLQFTGSTLPKPVKLHIVGIYQPRDLNDPFWGPDTLSAQFQADVPQGSRAYDAAFVTPATLAATNSSDVAVASDMILGPRVLSVHDAIAIHDQILSATTELKPRGYRIETDFTNLSNAVILDTNRIFTSVPLGAGEVVLFGWFTLFLAIRSTALTRRHDVGVLKLRGVRRRGLWTLMTEQSTVPILAGLPFGMAAGFVGARFVAGAVRASENIKLAALFALAAALVAVIGGLAAALVAERSALATPVVELLRSTPPRRRGWRSDIADLVLVVIAIVGVVQIHKSGAAGGPTLAVLAPALTAFAVGLVVARTLVPLSRYGAGVARRGGRVRPLLINTYLARRPGLDRIFALLVIGVAFCGYSIMAWSSQAEARSDRSTLEVGPSTVLTVAPLPPARLLQAVRAADPSGRYAMAATQYSIGDSPKVLAVDSSRLAAVVPQGPSGSDAALAAAIKPTPVHQIEVTGGSIRLSLDASHVAKARPTYVVAVFSGAIGPVAGVFGPLTNGAHSYPAAMPACTSSRPCDLAKFQISGLPSIATVAGGATDGTVVVLKDLRQTGPDGSPAASDRSLFGPAGIAGAQWRTATDSTAVGPIMTTSSAGLSLTVPMPTYPKSETLDATAYLLNVPLPLPAVVAGSPVLTLDPGVLAVQPFGFANVPVAISQTRAVLPRIENSGVLIDLDYAQAVSGLAEGGQVSEVWLAAGTPQSVLRALAAQGVIRTGSDTIATRSATYAAEPQVVGLRFQLVAGLISLALAAAALLLVASVERDPRAADLVALRRQGVSARVARGVAIGAYAVLAVAALIFGFLTAIIDRFASGSVPPFRDGWHVLARPPTLPPLALLTGVAIAVVVLGCAAALSAHQVTRAVRNEMKEAGQP